MKKLKFTSALLIISTFSSLFYEFPIYATSKTAYNIKAKVNTQSTTPLNVRSTPAKTNGNVIGKFKNGIIIAYSPKTIKNGYVQVRGSDLVTGSNIEGWSAKQYIYETKNLSVISDSPGIVNSSSNLTSGVPNEYREGILNLKKAHPNWIFQFYDAGLNLEKIVDLQYKMNSPAPKTDISKYQESNKKTIHERTNIIRSLYPNLVKRVYRDGKVMNLKLPLLTDDEISRIYLKDGNFLLSTKESLKYFIDPSNFLDNSAIYQFLDLEFNENYQNIDSVKEMLKNTYFSKDINNYANWFFTASKSNNINPYFLISKAVVEGGAANIKSNNQLLTGVKSGNKSYYNYFGINAVDGNSFEGAKTYAVSHNWSSPESSINGGAKYISKNYISEGQDTFYTLRYNITGKYGYLQSNTFDHQYASNIADAAIKSSVFSKNVRNLFDNTKLIFKIPTFK